MQRRPSDELPKKTKDRDLLWCMEDWFIGLLTHSKRKRPKIYLLVSRNPPAWIGDDPKEVTLDFF